MTKEQLTQLLKEAEAFIGKKLSYRHPEKNNDIECTFDRLGTTIGLGENGGNMVYDATGILKTQTNDEVIVPLRSLVEHFKGLEKN